MSRTTTGSGTEKKPRTTKIKVNGQQQASTLSSIFPIRIHKTTTNYRYRAYSNARIINDICKSPHNLCHVCTVHSFNLIRFHRIHLLSANNMKHFILWNASLTIPKSTHHKKDNVFISNFLFLAFIWLVRVWTVRWSFPFCLRPVVNSLRFCNMLIKLFMCPCHKIAL